MLNTLFYWFLWVIAFVFGVAGVFLGTVVLLGQTILVMMKWGPWHLTLVGAWILPAYAAAILIHELGHAAAARLGGSEILIFKVLWFALVREEKTYRFRWNFGPRKVVGYVALPIRNSPGTSSFLFFFYLAGPLANLLTAAVCFALAQHFTTPRSGGQSADLMDLFPGSPIPIMLNILGGCNLFLGCGSMMPLTTSDLLSDGACLAGLLSQERSYLQRQATTVLSGEMLAGIRPRDWDPGQLTILQLPVSTRARMLHVDLYLYYHAIDVGDVSGAEDYLENVIAKWDRISIARTKRAVAIEAAYFKAFYRNDAATARSWMMRLPDVPVEEHTRLRGEAAVLLAEGRAAEAANAAEAGIAAVPASMDRGGSLAEKDWLEAILTACRTTIQQTSIRN
jgi:Peptidase family M50